MILKVTLREKKTEIQIVEILRKMMEAIQKTMVLMNQQKTALEIQKSQWTLIKVIQRIVLTGTLMIMILEKVTAQETPMKIKLRTHRIILIRIKKIAVLVTRKAIARKTQRVMIPAT